MPTSSAAATMRRNSPAVTRTPRTLILGMMPLPKEALHHSSDDPRGVLLREMRVALDQVAFVFEAKVAVWSGWPLRRTRTRQLLLPLGLFLSWIWAIANPLFQWPNGGPRSRCLARPWRNFGYN